MTTILTDKVVTTRKSHQCHGCGCIYLKGSKMRFNTFAYEGTVHSTYMCETCEYVIQNHWEQHDLENGIMFGAVKEDDNGFWESVRVDIECNRCSAF